MAGTDCVQFTFAPYHSATMCRIEKPNTFSFAECKHTVFIPDKDRPHFCSEAQQRRRMCDSNNPGEELEIVHGGSSRRKGKCPKCTKGGTKEGERGNKGGTGGGGGANDIPRQKAVKAH